MKRSKSNDLLSEKSSSHRLRKKSLDGERRPSFKDTPPALPDFTPQPVIDTFGGEDYVPRPSMSSTTTNGQYGNSSVPPLPTGATDGSIEHHTRTESMTHRSRYSYAHSATSSAVNSPRRVRRRKDPTPYK